MPTKRNRKDSESSNCSAGFLEEHVGISDLSSFVSSGCPAMIVDGGGDEVAWLRPCCTPLGCILGGQVNLTEPDEIEKIVCSNETCPAGPYMHKECFGRWEDGLLTYLRSHGRARSWSEKQRRQNLWTKRGYDLAYRACTCICGRGHLRKDLNWNPKDVNLPCDSDKKTFPEEGAKKKNRKKHKDLPVLGNKYTFGVARSKSKSIPTSKDSRVRTSSTSSVLSVDQGYSSSSPSNSDIFGPLGNGAFFSPPQNGRPSVLAGHRGHASFRSTMSHGMMNAFPHAALPEIPDNDILYDFCGNMTHFPASYENGHPSLMPPNKLSFGDVTVPCSRDLERTTPPCSNIKSLSGQYLQDKNLSEIGNMMSNMGISKMQQSEAWNAVQHSPLLDIQSPTGKAFDLDFMKMNGEVLMRTCSGMENRRQLPAMRPNVPTKLNDSISPVSSFCGTWNQQSSQTPKQEDINIFCGCYSSNKAEEQQSLLPFRDISENASTMLCSDIDLKKPKVIIIPGDSNAGSRGSACTEICITPMCSTLFYRRCDFNAFKSVLKPSEVNPYRIKMEGEGYGSDDFRNSVLAKLSRAKCSQINCITCKRALLVYNHFPLVDGAMFLSPVKNVDQPHNELRIEIENKSDYLHAVCVWCLEGASNIICRMCEGYWRAPFHQLGSLYMYDVFAAAPCCQSRLCCKRCGVAIVDRRIGLKYYSQYSNKATCRSCGTVDYHFVHPASTFKVLGRDPRPFPYF